MQHYMPTDAYHDVLDQLENLFEKFDPAAPDDLRTRLIMILGDHGAIWPASCFTGQQTEPFAEPSNNPVIRNQ